MISLIYFSALLLSNSPSFNLNFTEPDKSLSYVSKVTESHAFDVGAYYNQDPIPIDSIKDIEKICNLNDSAITIWLWEYTDTSEAVAQKYILFYLINNTNQTISVPYVDAKINYVSTSVRDHDTSEWLDFQKTYPYCACGLSCGFQKLESKTAFFGNLDGEDINYGYKDIQFRMSYTIKNRIIHSNAINIRIRHEIWYYLTEGEWW